MPTGRTATTRGRQPLRRFVRRLAWLAVPLVVAGEAGHHVLQVLGRELAHHFFHIVFGVGAGLAFAVVVALDVRRHGWPTFTLRGDRSQPGRGMAQVPPR